MSTQYQIRVYDREKNILHIITDMHNFSYTKEVNAPGILSFELASDHPSISDFELDGIIEVWRANLEQEIDWYCDFYGFFRGEERVSDSDGNSVFRVQVVGQLDILNRSIIAYPSEITGRTKFTGIPAETIVKELVKYNASSSGTTADGRKRTVGITRVTIEPDGIRGTSLDVQCAWRPLLSVLQDVAATGGGDFDLVPDLLNTWKFTWYPGQRGTDRSASLVFALEYGNITNPKLTRSYVSEKTVGIVGGQGQEAARTTVVRTGTNYNADYNEKEVFVDARNISTTTGLQQYGDAVLSELRAKDTLSFDVLQVPQTLYGKDYFLGDLVTGRYSEFSATKKIQKVSVAMAADGQEQIKVELVDTI